MKDSTETWREVTATVTACRYDMAAGRALAFGLPSSKHFRIAFTYWADGTLHSGEYRSATAVPQGTLFSVRYHPEAPHRNDKEAAPPSLLRWKVGLGIAGSVILSMVWLALLRGCR